MNIILVSNRMSRALALGPRHVGILLAVGFLTLLGLLTLASWATYNLTQRLGWNVPVIPTLPGIAQQGQLDDLAVKLGQMQAQLLRLDSMTRQVAEKTGINPAPFQSRKEAPQGGADSTRFTTRALDYSGLVAAIDATGRQIETRLDEYGLIETLLTRQNVHRWQAPANLPVAGGVQTSLFGWRIDPFSGRQSFHEGVDFIGEVGVPIQAAAAGRVVTAEFHAQYGNMVELDHGHEVTSRYAHASRLLVAVGDTVKGGQKIALLGSTGRSTGPHLHFEIRYKGVPQNPLYFLTAAQREGGSVAQAP